MLQLQISLISFSAEFQQIIEVVYIRPQIFQ